MKKSDLTRSLENQKFPPKIIKAFEKTDRSRFVSLEQKAASHEDVALPIGHGQTISQPYTIAFMLMILETDENQKILEVGSGSGYALELLSNLNPHGKIFGIERIKELANLSKKKLKKIKNVKIAHGESLQEFETEAPFDRILVSAAAKKIPQKLLKQLKFGGVMVVPVENSILVIKKMSGQNKIQEYKGFSFVPLIEK